MRRTTLFLIGLFLTAGIFAAQPVEESSSAPKADNVEAINQEGYFGLCELYRGGDCNHQLLFNYTNANEGTLNLYTTRLYRDFEEPDELTEGTYKRITEEDGVNGEYRYTIEEFYEDGRALTGRFRMRDLTNSEGIVRITFLTEWPGLAKANQTLDFYFPDGLPTVKLGQNPTVTQLLKGVYPYTMDGILNLAYRAIIEGKEPEAGAGEKTVDVPNGYIRYISGGAPPSGMECCKWRCSDGGILFIINCMKESIDVLPTSCIWCFKYDPDTQTIEYGDIFNAYETRINPDDETSPAAYLWHGEKRFALELPRQGKNIKLHFLAEDDSITETHILRWNGNGFNDEEGF